MYEVVIKNGRLLSRDGSPPFQADVGIAGGYIAAIGQHLTAHRTIEAGGLYVVPGFIDMHSHSDLAVLRSPASREKICQGVTTEVLGNCGFSLFPVSSRRRKETLDLLRQLFPEVEAADLFPSAGEYLARIGGSATNVVTLTGHNVARVAVNGYERELSPAGIRQLRQMVDVQLASGTWGVSTGLLYAPACFCRTDELAALAECVKARQGLFSWHMRDEAEALAQSVDEVIAVTERTGVSTQISHLKASGRANWGKLGMVLERITRAAAGGSDLHFDCYPYTYGNTTITTLLPLDILGGDMDGIVQRLQDDGFRTRVRLAMRNGAGCLNSVGPENIVLSTCNTPVNRRYLDQSLVDAAHLAGKEVFDFIFDLVVEERGQCAIFLHQMGEEDVKLALAHPLGCLGTDGIPVVNGKAHPRLSGSFPRMLGHYVREEKICALPEAIRKLCVLPSRKLRLQDRGRLEEGCVADVVLFDLEKMDAESCRHNGIEYVLVNGQVAVEQGEYNGARAGRALRR